MSTTETNPQMFDACWSEILAKQTVTGVRAESLGARSSEPSDWADLRVSPNPVTDGQLTLRGIPAELPGAEVSLVDLQGRTVFDSGLVPGLGESATLDLPGVAAGLYILSIKAAGEMHRRSIVVQ